MAKMRVMSRREHFWRQLLPGVDDEEMRQIILAFIKEEQVKAWNRAEAEEPEGRTVAEEGAGI